MSATWASVSTFCTRVGAPPTPRSNTGGRLNAGTAEPAADPADQRGFLAGQEPRRGGHDLGRDLVAPGRRPLGERVTQQAQQLLVPVHVEDGAPGADRLGG